MTTTNFKNGGRFGPGLVGKLFLLLSVMSLLGCVAAIPAVIYYEENHKGFAVTAQLPVSADKIYQAALDIIKENPTKYKIIKKDDQKMRIDLEAKHEDGIHKDVVKVTRIDDKQSQLLAIAATPSGTKANKTSALATVKILCDKLGVKYKLIKG